MINDAAIHSFSLVWAYLLTFLPMRATKTMYNKRHATLKGYTTRKAGFNPATGHVR